MHIHMDFFLLLLPAALYWVSFSFTPGPFWLSWMNYHSQPNTAHTYKVYLLYLLTYFAGMCFALSYAVQTVVVFTSSLLLPLYFIGSGVMIYIAVESYRMQAKKQRLRFTYVTMVSISITNPKVYLSVPAGALSVVGLTHSTAINSLLFSYVVMVPIVLSGSLLFFALGKLSLKSGFTQPIQRITSLGLFAYGLYLAVEGVLLAGWFAHIL